MVSLGHSALAHSFANLRSKSQIAPCSVLSFQGCFSSSHPGMIQIQSPSGVNGGYSHCNKGSRPYIIKVSASLRSGFLSCNTAHCYTPFCALQHKNTYALVTTATNNELFFVSNPVILCLLPASVKLWQTNMLTLQVGWNFTQTLQNAWHEVSCKSAPSFQGLFW